MEQQKIWAHFQNQRVDSFDHARGRYAAMAAAVARRHRGAAGRVLNIGIGAGGVERLLAAQGWRVSSLDPGEQAVAAMAGAGFDAHCGWAQDMPFGDGRFDVVVASEVLEHIERATRLEVLREVRRVLAPGGWFIGSVPWREHLPDLEVICPDCGKVFHRWGHVDSFDLEPLREELAPHFDEVQCLRRSFVDWARARRSARGLVKALAQSALGRLGEPIASPSILFAARRGPA
jgi:SAM-dependent methyltransferase